MNNTRDPVKSGTHVALVTGATGFVGSNLVRRLVQKNWNVHVVSRKHSSFPNACEFSRVINHFHDGTTQGMIQLVEQAKPDVVFHLASLFLSQHTPNDIERLILSNVLFGSQLLEGMKANGVTRLVNTGTSWQHYQNKQYSPVNLYAATKQAFEALMQYYVEAHNFQAITLKLFDTYGPDDPRPKLVNLLKKVIATNQPLAMSPGAQRIDLVHVDDVACAFEHTALGLLADTLPGHEAYAVTTGKPIQLRELVKLVEQRLGKELPIIWGGLPYRTREVMEPWEGKPLPGWNAQINVEQVIKILCS